MRLLACSQRVYTRVAVLSEVSPNGEEYFRFFRQECRRHNLKIVSLETVSQTPANLTENLDSLRQSNPDALCYMGYGMLAAQGFLRKALDELAWDPPRIMGTAFMFYLMGFEKFEGWVGIDQFDPNNPLDRGISSDGIVERHQADPPMWPNAIPVLAYDTARVLAEGLFRAPSLSGPGLKDGLEKIRFMPSTHRWAAHAYRRRTPRAWDVPGRLAALWPGTQRKARVRGTL